MRQRSRAGRAGRAADAELAQRASAGDLDAFEALYRRHVDAAWRVALAVAGNPHDAADAVSDAFTRVFQAFPGRFHETQCFLPYLLASVRNSAIDVLRRGGRNRATDAAELDNPALGPEPSESVVATVESELVARAFASLPERWRSVLWLTEVEGIPAREVAAMLGVSPNGVAQLAVRARAGLRQRFLQAHLGDGEVGSVCRYTVDHLGAYVAGGLAPRDIAKVDQHLAACDTCRSRRAELEDVAPSLRRAVVPLPAGLAALTVGRWRLGSTGATGATAAAPAGLGVGAAVVVAPAPFVASVASVALFVAGIVGVGVVEHRSGRAAALPAATTLAAPAPEATFTPASAENLGAGGGDPVAALVDERAGEADELAALAAGASGPLPAPPAPEVPATPDPGEVEQLVRGNLAVDLGTLAAPVVAQVVTTCPTLRVAGATIDCQAPNGPSEPGAPGAPGTPEEAPPPEPPPEPPPAGADATVVVLGAVADPGNTRAPAR